MIVIFGWILLLFIFQYHFFLNFREWFKEKSYDTYKIRMARYRQVTRCSKCDKIVTPTQRFERFCPYCHARGTLLFMDVYDAYEDGYGKTIKGKI